MNRELRQLPSKIWGWLIGRGVARNHWRRYVLAGLCSVLGVIQVCVAYVVLMPKRYTSEWSVILPGAGINTRVALDRLGQAQSSASSPFSAKELSPRVNYKEIATSAPVQHIVAKMVGEPPTKVRKPQIKLINQSSIIEFKVTAASAEMAQRLAWAYHEALKQRLDALRSEETRLRNQAVEESVGNVEKNLAGARKKLLALQLESGLTSIDQYKQMIASIENLRVEQAGLQAQLAEKHALVESLAAKLGIKAEDATPLLLLSTDTEFRELWKTAAAQSASQIDIEARLGSDHPRVREAAEKSASLSYALRRIADKRGGLQLAPAILNLASSDHDRVVELLSELIRRQSEIAGQTSRIEAISALLAEHEKRRIRLGSVAAKLDDLERDHQIANAVFSSALARIDVSKSDIYASYPLLQLLQEPSLPLLPSSPRILFAIVGGVLGSLLAVMAWTFAWLHQWFAAIRLTRKSYSPQLI